jgi:hypothetical protein
MADTHTRNMVSSEENMVNPLTAMRPITYVAECPGNMGGWKERHAQAIRLPVGHERPIVNLLSAWCDYAFLHQHRFESGIGEDYVLGPEWAAIGAAIRGLLNGECGRLDCGTLDSILCHNLTVQGFDPEQL